MSENHFLVKFNLKKPSNKECPEIESDYIQTDETILTKK